MRCVVQRVLEASVEVEGYPVRTIMGGLCVLVGISRYDTSDDVKWMVNKLLNLKIFSSAYAPDESSACSGERWLYSLKDANADLLLISQFTLYHMTKGTKLDFHKACKHEEAKKLFNQLVASCQKSHDVEKVQVGFFGEHMKINLKNDGPVTLVLESPFSIKAEEDSKRERRNVVE